MSDGPAYIQVKREGWNCGDGLPSPDSSGGVNGLTKNIHTGCCGWSYLDTGEFHDKIAVGYSSKLQAYAQLFDAVEINSTFYRLPQTGTAERWRKEADEVNPDFEFTLKAFRGITHLHRFQKRESLDSFEILKELCSVLWARFLLFQSPASFKPTPANMDNMRTFFDRIDHGGLTMLWEPRGAWYDDPSLIERVCIDNDLVHCVDPFRNDALVFGKPGTAYFRLHGFGKPAMYNYDFSVEELKQLTDRIEGLPGDLSDVYVFFNNEKCYLNGTTFRALTES